MGKKKLAVAALVVAVIAIAGWVYYDYRSVHPSTNDAYVGMHVIRVAAQVSGPVDSVRVSNQQAVRQGELLLTLDPAPFRIAVQHAEAQLAEARDARDAQDAEASAAEAELKAAQAKLTEARRHSARITALAAKGTASRDQADAAVAAQRNAEQAVSAARSRLQAARAKLGGDGQANAQVKIAEAALAKAQLDLSHTRITAPADGVVGDFSLRPGGFVSAGQPLLALVETGEVWVDANYKETELGVIRPGQHAQVEVDMLPGKRFDGVVQSLSPASGAAFSLLPPENATGNWVKVTQRFPVRVRLSDPGDALRVGASASVTIDASGD